MERALGLSLGGGAKHGRLSDGLCRGFLNGKAGGIVNKVIYRDIEGLASHFMSGVGDSFWMCQNCSRICGWHSVRMSFNPVLCQCEWSGAHSVQTSMCECVGFGPDDFEGG